MQPNRTQNPSLTEIYMKQYKFQNLANHCSLFSYITTAKDYDKTKGAWRIEPDSEWSGTLNDWTPLLEPNTLFVAPYLKWKNHFWMSFYNIICRFNTSSSSDDRGKYSADNAHGVQRVLASMYTGVLLTKNNTHKS